MRVLCGIFIGLVFFGIVAPILATPSSTHWTNCTIDIQAAGTTDLGVYNFFGFGSNSAVDEFPVGVGVERGAQLTPSIAAEFGVDLLSSPSTTPFLLNAKIGYRENVITKNAPGIGLCFFNFGTSQSDTANQQNVVCLIVGKTLPNKKTRVSAAYYIGNSNSLKSSSGEVTNTGYMFALDHQLVKNKWVLAGDYASGQNIIGGGGIGVYYYFANNISVLTGPVWFNDKGLNGSPKMLVQIDVTF